MKFIYQFIYCRCDALDEMGDRSTTEERWRYFEELDTDHSDGIDFEEFLEVCWHQSLCMHALEILCL